MKTPRNGRVSIGVLLVAALFIASCSSDDDVAPPLVEEAPAEEAPEEEPIEEEVVEEEPAVEKVAVCNSSDQSVARLWDEAALDAVRRDFPAPTVHIRNLFHMSVAMWDSWALVGSEGSTYLETYDEPSAEIAAEDVDTVISFAAYRLLTDRYREAKNGDASLAQFDSLLEELCVSGDDVDVEGSAAAFGDHVGAEVYETFSDDGSLEAQGYKGPYEPVNDPLILVETGTTMDDPNRWQQLLFALEQNEDGEITEKKVQGYVSPHWGAVTSFALPDSGDGLPIDPGPPPLLGGDSEDEFRIRILDVIRESSKLDPDSGVMLDISPGAVGNNLLGTDDGIGHSVNTSTFEAYEENLVLEGDFHRVIAEFWADGPTTETPAGHWNVIANEATDALSELRIGGQGDSVSPLQWDLSLYFALNGAMHDSAVAAWGVKRVYDYTRPISMIRYLGKIGELTIEPGLVEKVTASSSAAGERHEHLAGSVGEIAILAWAPDPVEGENLGTVQWILAGDWFPYQGPNFVTPAFPGYVSGHSTFSRSAAEILTAITGDVYFPGGMATFIAPANSLKFEDGPTADVELQWATYYDAADQAGHSRISGGIHVLADDYAGRNMGAQIGKAAWAKASSYFP